MNGYVSLPAAWRDEPGQASSWVETALAQARAQSAESRLRDAIESTSEAFVLWDRNGRMVVRL